MSCVATISSIVTTLSAKARDIKAWLNLETMLHCFVMFPRVAKLVGSKQNVLLPRCCMPNIIN